MLTSAGGKLKCILSNRSTPPMYTGIHKNLSDMVFAKKKKKKVPSYILKMISVFPELQNI